ncbi:putative DnaA recombination protein [uncultured Mediterranean phage uvMED]|nr:putative DnaA recombination protein [uncultured Mediterranean phage uvMED]
MNFAWDTKGLSKTEKLVYLSLADQANDEGVCFPSINYTANRTDSSRRGVQMAVRSLARKGLLEIFERKNQSSVYKLHEIEGGANSARGAIISNQGRNYQQSGGETSAPITNIYNHQITNSEVSQKKYDEEAQQILKWLNKKTQKDFRGEGAYVNIRARLREGFTPDECRAVIARKWREWKDDPVMAKFIKPSTLFNKQKFADYVGDIPKVESEGESK